MINRESFINPDAIYRSAPFWALNDHLDSDELKRQINEFKKQGMGGAFLHPRGGLSTKYLSDKFFGAIRTCLEEFEKLNMIGWLYDEDRFPSGMASGKVTKLNSQYCQKCLVPSIKTSKDIEITDNTLALFLLKECTYERLELDNIPDNEKILSISLVESYKESRFDNQSFVDVCNKEAIDAFIDITHNKYYEHFKEYFGNIVPAIFTDEPHFKNKFQGSLPWTMNFDIKFMKAYSYDLLDHLPALFLNIGEYQKIRFNYWDLIASMFVEAFSKNVYKWCEDKKIAYTGHFWEHVFPYPTHSGSVMPHYEYMQYPGIDMLFVADPKATDQYGNDFIVKEASSVANQLGKERVLSETYGASGWGLDFRYQKRATDWQLALGINLFSQHLSLYSLIGYRKRDFPLSFLDHQPWWESYRMLGDYMGRLCYALSQGQYQADVLVLHPSSTTWASYGSMESNTELSELGNSVRNLVKQLNQLQIMFDLGDDIILSKHGKVEDQLLIIGLMKYRVILLPDMTVMRDRVFYLLQSFLENGGKIITTGQTPTFLDGVYSNELIAFFQHPSITKVTPDKSALSDLLFPMDIERLYLEEVHQKDLSNIYAHIRKEKDIKTLFICNLDLDQKVELKLIINAPYAIQEFDTETGECRSLDVYTTCGNNYYLSIHLEALNSVLLMLNENDLVSPKTQATSQNSGKLLPLTNWSVKPLDPNAINLQYCRAALNYEPYGEMDDVLVIDDLLKDRLGMERGNIFVRQPWMYKEEEKNTTHFIKAEYPFIIETIPCGDVLAVVELPDLYQVFINDIKVNHLNTFYKDRAFIQYDIKSFITLGENVIRLESKNYGVLINLESVYIVGDFKLTPANGQFNRQFAIDEIIPLHTGNIVEQGYPYYSGKIAYTTEVFINKESDFTQALLTLDGFDGVSATIKVNDVKVQTLGWKPYTANITQYLRKGNNTITIEIANSLQNLLGPFAKESNLNLVTPQSFYGKKHEQFLPTGFDGYAVLTLS